MSNLRMATGLRNSMLDEITAVASSSATLTLYAGIQPSGGGAATTQLAQLTCAASFANAAAAGVLTIGSITSDAAADATGTATWFRLATKSGAWIMDGDISTSTAGTGDLQLDDTAIVLNGTVSLSGPNNLTAPNAA